MYILGVDIGGTKCVVTLGEIFEGSVRIIKKMPSRETKKYSPMQMLDAMIEDMKNCIQNKTALGIGISCGGPLNAKTGIILSPPNLIGWDEIHIVEYFEEAMHLPAWLCNDAKACALAEWQMGAGQGCDNMIFLTFGTGLGAGLILDGKLYQGASGMSGEVGHIRLENFGPVGFAKAGSFEGFCSGGGIAQIAQTVVRRELQKGNKPAMCGDISQLSDLDTKTVALSAKEGDPLAIEILEISGEYLGKGLSILIDIFNPEKIVIGSIFARCYDFIWPKAKEIIDKECLAISASQCQVVPCALGESVGDYAALMIAQYNINN